jgi:hypothetical protein
MLASGRHTGAAAPVSRLRPRGNKRCFGYVSSRACSRIGPTLRRRSLGSSTRRVPAGNPRHRKPFGGPGTRERLPARLDFALRRVRSSSSEPGAPRVARPAHRIEVVAAVWLPRKRAGATSGGSGFGQGHPETTSRLVQASARSDRELRLGGSRARPVSIVILDCRALGLFGCRSPEPHRSQGRDANDGRFAGCPRLTSAPTVSAVDGLSSEASSRRAPAVHGVSTFGWMVCLRACPAVRSCPVAPWSAGLCPASLRPGLRVSARQSGSQVPTATPHRVRLVGNGRRIRGAQS